MTRVGFAGLGLMGRPMARNLLRGGADLVVWNRTAARSEELVALGAVVAADPGDLFARARTVVLMLADGAAVDEVLDRRGPAFERRVRGHTVVAMGTAPPAYSRGLEADVRAAGGRYVEAPVSGSRLPAEAGELVVMLAGADADVAEVEPLLAPLGSAFVRCGPVPAALTTKLAVNLYLVTLVAALGETWAFAARHGLDPAVLREVLDAGPMASQVSRARTRLLAEGRYDDVQTALSNARGNADLIEAAADEAALDVPLLARAAALYRRAEELGAGGLDMAAVVRAYVS